MRCVVLLASLAALALGLREMFPGSLRARLDEILRCSHIVQQTVFQRRAVKSVEHVVRRAVACTDCVPSRRVS